MSTEIDIEKLVNKVMADVRKNGPPAYIVAAAALTHTSGVRSGHIVHVHVLHDDYCALLNGRGACNCEPEVRLMSTDPRKTNGQPT